MPFSTTQDPRLWADQSLAGAPLTRADARAVLDWPDEDLLDLVAAAHRVRRARFGRRVKMNFLVNLQSGLCPEDCSYCSQSKISKAPIEKYRFLSADEVVDMADRAVASGAAASPNGPPSRVATQASSSRTSSKSNTPSFIRS